MAAKEDRFSALLRFHNQRQEANREEQQYADENEINDEIDRQDNALVDQGMGMYEVLLERQLQQVSSTATTGIAPSTSDAVGEDFVVMKYDVEIFINEMENYPCLWNTSTRSHHVQNMRKVAWEELSKKFGKTGIYNYICYIFC